MTTTKESKAISLTAEQILQFAQVLTVFATALEKLGQRMKAEKQDKISSTNYPHTLLGYAAIRNFVRGIGCDPIYLERNNEVIERLNAEAASHGQKRPPRQKSSPDVAAVKEQAIIDREEATRGSARPPRVRKKGVAE